MKRVLLISNLVMHYRVSVYNYFAERFCGDGWDFSVLADSVEGHAKDRVAFALHEVAFSTPTLISRISSMEPDVVILFLHLRDRITLPLMHWLKLKRIPFGTWTKGANLDAPTSRVSHAAFSYVHWLSDAILLYSKGCMAHIHPRHRWKTFIANNTLNFHAIPAVSESKAAIKASLGVPFETVVLFVGRIDHHDRKKVSHLIEVFGSVERSDIGLVIVGSGLREELRRRLNPKNTLYLGAVHDADDLLINRLFKMADICSIPGHVGLGLNHAFHWGLPVVTEDGGQPPEIEYLRDGRNGFLVPTNDITGLRSRILELADDPEKRQRFSQNALDDIRHHAPIEGMYDAFLNACGFLLGQRRSAQHH